MDTEILKALEASIKHWKKDALDVIVHERKVPMMRGSQCALCKLFYEEECIDCPLDKAGQSCENLDSIWNEYYAQHVKFNNARIGEEEDEALSKAEAAAKRMVDLLKTLHEEAVKGK